MQSVSKKSKNNIISPIWIISHSVVVSLKGTVIPEEIIIIKDLKGIKFVSDYFQIQSVNKYYFKCSSITSR